MLYMDPNALYAPHEAAAFFKVNVNSVYQSIPGKNTRPKLGRTLPEPIRFGRLIRWTGQQLIDFVKPPSSQVVDQIGSSDPQARKKPGRPRKVAPVTGGMQS